MTLLQVDDLLEVAGGRVVLLEILERLQHGGAAAVDGVLRERVVDVRNDPLDPAHAAEDGDDEDPERDETPGNVSPRPGRLVLRRSRRCGLGAPALRCETPMSPRFYPFR